MTGRIASLSVVIALTVSCSADPGAPPSSGAAPAASPGGATQPVEWFTDQAAAAGLDVVHYNGATGRLYYPEILPPGVALFDYDNDGDLDVYIVQSKALGAGPAAQPPANALPLRGRLYRNDLTVAPDGTRRLHFTDVTEQSGIDARGFGIGVAAADIDNDGWVDLYLTNFGSSQMWHNNGDGTFTDVTAASGTGNPGGFGVSAAFLDYDRDGWLDLYVGNNVNYRLENEKVCPNTAGVPDYCPPQIYGGQLDRLYRNLGHGRFADVTAKALAGARVAPALGVSTADFNGDGWIDLFVANDGEDNQLWLNQRDGTFKETGLLAGVALTAEGKAEASMGVDAGDFDNDGDDDLIMTELTGQGSNVYLNDGRANFRDASAASGLGAASLPFTGWGTSWFDFDNDGWLDALAVNGTIVASDGRAGRAFPYDQRKLLLRNLGTGRFEDVTSRAGAVFGLSLAGRGAAFGDVDNDGDIDVLVGNAAGPVQLLINNIGNRKHWLGVRLAGPSPSGEGRLAGPKPAGRDMLGARIGVTRASGPTLWRRARSDGSYASANDPRVLVGLGDSTERPRVQVQWPDGPVGAMAGGGNRSVDHADAGQWEVIRLRLTASARQVPLPWPAVARQIRHPRQAVARQVRHPWQAVARRTRLAIAITVVMAGACGRQDAPLASKSVDAQPATPDGRALGAVTLPDLAQMAASAQTQMRDQYAALQRTIADKRASAGDRSAAYGDMGKLLMAAQSYDAAEVSFLNAQALDSSDYRWPYYLGHLYRLQGQLEKARARFERTLQLRPDDMAALVWMGDVYLSSGLPDAAQPQFAKALSLDPQSVSARYGLGRTALAKNDPRTAATYLEEVLKLNPNAGDAHYPLSLAYAALGDSARAGEQLRLRRSQRIQPSDPLMAELDELLESPQTYETLGIRALAREDWPTAAASFRKGLELVPTSPALRFRLATTMNMMGDPGGAQQLFEAVVHDNPEYFPAQFSLGVVLQAKGSHALAAARFTAALKERPDYAEARLRLASSLRHLGRTREALSQYQQVATANPDLTEAHIGYAMMLAQLGRFQDARDYLAGEVKAHPEQLTFTHGLARLLAAAPEPQVRDGAQAMALVQAMLAKGRTPELGETMAMTLAALGQYDEAAKVQRDLMRTVDRLGLAAAKPRLARNLQLYERHQPCSMPWTSEEMP